MKKLLSKIGIKFDAMYWYCGDLLTYSELCSECFADTGFYPDYNYIEEHWKASFIDVIIYKINRKLNPWY